MGWSGGCVGIVGCVMQVRSEQNMTEKDGTEVSTRGQSMIKHGKAGTKRMMSCAG
jgi:hypothetical protein